MVVTISSASFLDPVLIETLWNVNLFSPVVVFNRIIVLIETLWNVNLVNGCKTHRFFIVLIETLWNVNTFTVVRCTRDTAY